MYPCHLPHSLSHEKYPCQLTSWMENKLHLLYMYYASFFDPWNKRSTAHSCCLSHEPLPCKFTRDTFIPQNVWGGCWQTPGLQELSFTQSHHTGNYSYTVTTGKQDCRSIIKNTFLISTVLEHKSSRFISLKKWPGILKFLWDCSLSKLR